MPTVSYYPSHSGYAAASASSSGEPITQSGTYFRIDWNDSAYFLFTGVDIPKGVSIDSATIGFTRGSTNVPASGPIEIVMYQDHDYTTIPATTASSSERPLHYARAEVTMPSSTSRTDSDITDVVRRAFIGSNPTWPGGPASMMFLLDPIKHAIESGQITDYVVYPRTERYSTASRRPYLTITYSHTANAVYNVLVDGYTATIEDDSFHTGGSELTRYVSWGLNELPDPHLEDATYTDARLAASPGFIITDEAGVPFASHTDRFFRHAATGEYALDLHPDSGVGAQGMSVRAGDIIKFHIRHRRRGARGDSPTTVIPEARFYNSSGSLLSTQQADSISYSTEINPLSWTLVRRDITVPTSAVSARVRLVGEAHHADGIDFQVPVVAVARPTTDLSYTYQPDEAGTRYISMDVIGADGISGTGTVVVARINTPPTASFSVDTDGLTATVIDSSTDPDFRDSIVRRWVDWGDGTLRTNRARNPRPVAGTSSWSRANGTGGGSTYGEVLEPGPDGLIGFYRQTITTAKTGGESYITYYETSFPTAAGEELSGSIWVRSSVDIDVELRLELRQGSTVVDQFTQPASLTAGQWTRLHAAGAATGDSDRVDLYVVVGESAALPQGATLDATQVLLEDGIELGPYFDGEMPGCTWTGNKSGSDSVNIADLTHTYAEPGEYEVTLHVRDTLNVRASHTATVLVNQPPVADALAVVSGLNVSLIDQSTDDGPLTRTVDWGDGTINSLLDHTYAASGTYTVTFTVTDTLGASDTLTIGVVANNPPDAVFTYTTGTGNDSQQVTVNTKPSYDPDGDAITRTVDWGDDTPPATVTTFPSHTNLVTNPRGRATSGTVVVRESLVAPYFWGTVGNVPSGWSGAGTSLLEDGKMEVPLSGVYSTPAVLGFQPGDTFTVAAKVHPLEGTSGRVGLNSTYESGAFVPGEVTYSPSSTPSEGGEVVTVTHTLTGEDARGVRIRIHGYVVEWVLLEAGSITGAFFDGDTSPDPDLTPEWTGTPGESTSRLVAPSPTGWGSESATLYYSAQRDALAMAATATSDRPFVTLALPDAPAHHTVLTHLVDTSDEQHVDFAQYQSGASPSGVTGRPVHIGETLRHVHTSASSSAWVWRAQENIADRTVYFRAAVVPGEYDGPYFDGDGPSTPPMQSPGPNLITAPRGRETSGTVVVRENLAHTGDLAGGSGAEVEVLDDGTILTVGLPSGTVYLRVRTHPDGLTLVPGATYTASAYMRSDDGSEDRLGAVRIQWYDADGSYMHANSGHRVTLSRDEWRRVEVTATAPEGATFFNLWIDRAGDGPDGRFLTDRILVERAGHAGAFFDGDTSPDPDLTPEWTGTPGESTSRLVAPRPAADGLLTEGAPVYYSPTYDAYALMPGASLGFSDTAGGDEVTLLARVVSAGPGAQIGAHEAGAPGPLAPVKAGDTYRAMLEDVTAPTWTTAGGQGPVYMRLGMVAGVYEGPYFDEHAPLMDRFEYAWDGAPHASTSTAHAGAELSHTYIEPGTYTITLTVTDIHGAQSTATADVTVVSPVSFYLWDGENEQLLVTTVWDGQSEQPMTVAVFDGIYRVPYGAGPYGSGPYGGIPA